MRADGWVRLFGALLGHLARIGGVLVRPRPTFARIVEGQDGSALELLPWVFILVSTLSPQAVGNALLLLRARFIDGLIDFASILGTRLTQALAGVLVGAAVLHTIERVRRPSEARMGFDRAIDVCAFMLVPFMLLAVIGFLLAAFGANLWWMPHNKMIGDAPTMIVRVLAGFGWSLALYALVVRSVWKAG
jgi:hypothetical protein